AALVLCALQLAWAPPPLDLTEPRNVFCLLAAALILARHRGNLARLLRGDENRIKESFALHQFGKTLHVLALGLWFGSSVFFTFVVTLSLLHTFDALGRRDAMVRPAWFPLPAAFTKIDAEANGPREQG